VDGIVAVGGLASARSVVSKRVPVSMRRHQTPKTERPFILPNFSGSPTWPTISWRMASSCQDLRRFLPNWLLPMPRRAGCILRAIVPTVIPVHSKAAGAVQTYGMWSYEDINIFLYGPTLTTPGVLMEIRGTLHRDAYGNPTGPLFTIARQLERLLPSEMRSRTAETRFDRLKNAIDAFREKGKTSPNRT
jgi:hypothetical protein